MQVLVTGGAGFIGAWIVKALSDAGHDVVVFDRHEARTTLTAIGGAAVASETRWITGDIGEPAALVSAGRGCDAIVHLAGLLTPACRNDPLLGARVNLMGMLNVFLCARENGVGAVAYMSSAGVFGPDGGEEPRPTTLYGAFKLGAEHSARAFHAEDGLSSIGFRPFVVYGPCREIGLSAGPSLACKAAAESVPYTIPFTGEIDMIHVSDVAAIFVAAVESPPAGAHVLNLLGDTVDIRDVVGSIRHLVPGARIEAVGAPMPVHVPRRDTELGAFFPEFRPMPLQDGLEATIEFYRKRVNA